MMDWIGVFFVFIGWAIVGLACTGVIVFPIVVMCNEGFNIQFLLPVFFGIGVLIFFVRASFKHILNNKDPSLWEQLIMGGPFVIIESIFCYSVFC